MSHVDGPVLYNLDMMRKDQEIEHLKRENAMLRRQLKELIQAERDRTREQIGGFW